MSLPRFAARVDSALRVELPFPPPELSPNKRLHWAKKAKVTAGYRGQCCWATELAGYRAYTNGEVDSRPSSGDIALTVTFHPPDNRKRDRTNMEAAFKAGFDGIADALGVDDNRFVPTYRKGEVVKGGKVIVEIGG